MKVVKTLDVPSVNMTFWSDSMNVLWWVRNNSRNFKPFIANRVGEIQTVSKPEQWRYIPSELNPADIISRGLSATELVNKKSWWDAPEFLKTSESQWPKNKVEKLETEERKSKVNSHVTLVMVATDKQQLNCESSDTINRLSVERYSNWQHMVRIYAWVVRFIENCKIKSKELRASGELQQEELKDIKIKLIRSAQMEHFESEYVALETGKEIAYKSKLGSLKPI